jgi:hypothetical protein
MRMYRNVIASEAKQSTPSCCRSMDCFAALAMTTYLRFARNDGLKDIAWLFEN